MNVSIGIFRYEKPIVVFESKLRQGELLQVANGDLEGQRGACVNGACYDPLPRACKGEVLGNCQFRILRRLRGGSSKAEFGASAGARGNKADEG